VRSAAFGKGEDTTKTVQRRRNWRDTTRKSGIRLRARFTAFYDDLGAPDTHV
jgi:hypothetical protein